MGFVELGPCIRPGSATEYEDYRISDAFSTDFRHINIGNPKNYKKYADADGNIIDEWGVGRKIIGKYLSITYSPLSEADDSTLKSYRWPEPEDSGRIEGLAEKAKVWYENSPYAITATSAVSGQFFDIAQYLRGSEEFFVDLYINPLFAEKLIDKICDVLIQMNLLYLKPIAPYIICLKTNPQEKLKPHFSRALIIERVILLHPRIR